MRKVLVKTPSSRETRPHRFSGQAASIKGEEDADLGSRPRYRREYRQRSSQRLQRLCARCGRLVVPQSFRHRKQALGLWVRSALACVSHRQ